ncbi:Hsp20/alpha crystallin family protein [Muricauda lutimaris]|uniref:Hsp20/alpha crystallin family protein n=1 Tax=Flagellimonas profundi TaxID=2915620 RepID=A0ABS3FKE3_9FLAO|nr:Hsp20/alpha crystallin family protein [Allomuricauda profundi]
MSLFGPRFYSAPEPNFSGLFRLIDDFDKYSQQSGQPGARQGRHIPTFTPKFDVKETENAYELHGELPGIDRENVHLEFTEPQSLTVRGKVERSYSAGEPPAGLLEESPAHSGAIESGDKGSPKPHPVTVEDAADDGTVAKTNSRQNDKDQQQVQQHKQQPQKPAAKYWVSERSIGEFSRTFSFPSRVDSDAVSASLNNGILTVTVPKAKKHESKRISVS